MAAQPLFAHVVAPAWRCDLRYGGGSSGAVRAWARLLVATCCGVLLAAHAVDAFGFNPLSTAAVAPPQFFRTTVSTSQNRPRTVHAADVGTCGRRAWAVGVVLVEA